MKSGNFNAAGPAAAVQAAGQPDIAEVRKDANQRTRTAGRIDAAGLGAQIVHVLQRVGHGAPSIVLTIFQLAP